MSRSGTARRLHPLRRGHADHLAPAGGANGARGRCPKIGTGRGGMALLAALEERGDRPVNASDCPDPEQLIDLARAGDGAALGRLLELYRGFLTLLARVQIGRRLKSKVDAADLVQETFLEAHRHFGRFRGTTEGELTGWLRQILATQ